MSQMFTGALDPVPTIGRVALALIASAVALVLVPEIPRWAGPRPRPAASPDPRIRQWGIPVVLLCVVGVVAPGALWLVLPATASFGVFLAVRRGRRTSRGSPRERVERRRWLIAHAELLASCLDSGLATAAALRAVGDVLRVRDGHRGAAGSRGPAGHLTALDSVAAMLLLGADADTAWRVVDTDEDLASLAAAARRSAVGGTTLADAVREHAAQLRDQARQEAARSAGRAGVLMTAPLGLCFLPAFLCLGLAPVVLGLLGQLTIR